MYLDCHVLERAHIGNEGQVHAWRHGPASRASLYLLVGFGAQPRTGRRRRRLFGGVVRVGASW